MANIPDPTTRQEQYLAAIAGSPAELPEYPITREEAYLQAILDNSGGGGGGGGTTNYNALSNKPKISNVELTGNKTLTDLGIASASALAALSTLVGDKVDKETGKGLSANDFTDDLKDKLSDIPSDAEKNVQADWNQTNATKDDYIKNKPTIPTVDSTLSDTSENPVQNKVIKGALDGKVDKVAGKGLSTNDYTDADKAEVAKVADKADADNVIDGASYDSANHLILFKNGSTTLFSLDAAAFVKDGMVDTVEITGGNLVITFNTDAGKQAISIPLTDIFDPANYYDKTATDNLLADKADDTSVYKTFSFGNTGSGGGTVKYIELTGAYPNNAAKENSYMITGRNGESAILVLPTGMAIGVYNDPRLLYLTRGTSTPIVSVNLDSTNGKVYVGIGSYTYIHISQIGGERTNWSGEIITELPSGATTVAIVSDVANKADKVTSATAGNFAGLNANGNLTDSGKKAADFATPEDVETSASAQGALLRDTVGWTGKNLIPFPFPFYPNNKAGDTISQEGISWTINSDNSITATGTGTGNGQLSLASRDDNSCLKLKQGKYIISGCPASLPINIHLGYTNNGAYADVPNSTATDGSESTFEITDSMLVEGKDYAAIAVYLQCRTQTVNNLTFYPMIRRADIADGTYEPYHESVETMYEEEIHGVNLLKGTLKSSTLSSGVTVTVSDDTVVTLNGTPATNTGATLITIDQESGIFKDGETYIISDGGSSEYYVAYIYLNGIKKSDSSTVYDIVRLQNKSTFTADFTTYSRYTLGIYVRTEAGTLSNKKFYLMLRKATIEDSTYRPYNHQAIQNQINAQGVLGAKNLIPYPYAVGTTTNNGITFTVNSDGTVVANGTSTAFATIAIRSRVSSPLKLPTGRYTISGGVSPNQRIAVGRTYNGAWQELAISSGNEASFNVSESDDIGISIEVTGAGIAVNNAVFKPMIRLASDPDDTYVPYAMTNRELTEKVADTDTIEVSSLLDSTYVSACGSFRYRVKNGICFVYINNIKFTSAAIDVVDVVILSEGVLPRGLIPASSMLWNKTVPPVLLGLIRNNDGDIKATVNGINSDNVNLSWYAASFSYPIV